MNILISALFVLVVIAASPATAKPRNAACDECVYYNFETGYDSHFTFEGACLDLQTWAVGKYEETAIELPNSFTKTFITPHSELSCTTSFPFKMTGGGNVFIRVYIDSDSPRFLDQVFVLAEQITEGNNPTMGMGVRSNTDLDFVNGWAIIQFPIFGFTSFEGQLVFMGLSSEESKILVDSFCYKPLGYTGECWVDETPTTTAAPTTTEAPTTEPATVPSINVTVTESVPSSSIGVTVPQPDFSTPPPGYDKCPVDPFFHWLLPHETDCHLFYYCVWGEKVLRECKDNLHFNRIAQVCDWPWNAGCAK